LGQRGWLSEGMAKKEKGGETHKAAFSKRLSGKNVSSGSAGGGEPQSRMKRTRRRPVSFGRDRGEKIGVNRASVNQERKNSPENHGKKLSRIVGRKGDTKRRSQAWREEEKRTSETRGFHFTLDIQGSSGGAPLQRVSNIGSSEKKQRGGTREIRLKGKLLG